MANDERIRVLMFRDCIVLVEAREIAIRRSSKIVTARRKGESIEWCPAQSMYL